jgi:DNA-binding FrmR family transcriptional regulator
MAADLSTEKKVNTDELPGTEGSVHDEENSVPEIHEHLHAREDSAEEAHDHEHTHEFMHAHGIPHSHAHGHGHVHTPEEKKRRLNRISRIIGHLEHVRRMIEADYDCADVLVQLSAVRSATNGLAKQIIHEHIEHCVSEAVESGDEETMEKLQNAIDKFI